VVNNNLAAPDSISGTGSSSTAFTSIKVVAVKAVFAITTMYISLSIQSGSVYKVLKPFWASPCVGLPNTFLPPATSSYLPETPATSVLLTLV